MGPGTGLIAYATWRPAVSGIRARGRRQGGEEETRTARRYPPYPRILWTLHMEVPYGLRVCPVLRYMD